MPIVKSLLPYNYLSSSSRALRYQLNTLHRSTSTVMIAINSLTAILDNDDDDEEEEDDMIRHVLQRFSRGEDVNYIPSSSSNTNYNYYITLPLIYVRIIKYCMSHGSNNKEDI